MAERQLPKLHTGVRFPSPALPVNRAEIHLTGNTSKDVHVYEVRPRKDHRGVDLISDALPIGGLWYTKPDDAVEYARFRSRSPDAPVSI